MQVEKEDVTPVQEQPSNSIQPKTNRLPKPFIILSVFVALAITVTLLAYQLPITNPVARSIVRLIPYPAAMVNGSMISMESYANEHDALLRYLESTGYEELPSEETVRQTILDALVNKAVIRELAFRAGMKIDEERVEAFYQDVIEGEGSEEAFIEELRETFGWTKEEFKTRIIESIVLALQMSEYVLADEELQAEARTQIETELANPGTIPEADLGVVSVANVPEAWTEILQLPDGERSGILETSFDFAIVKVLDRTEDTETGETQLHLSGVVVPKTTLEDLVENYLADARVRYFVK